MKIEFKSYLKGIVDEMKEIKLRLARIENLIREEMLTPSEIEAIKKAEEEIKKGKFITAQQLKKELGIE